MEEIIKKLNKNTKWMTDIILLENQNININFVKVGHMNNFG